MGSMRKLGLKKLEEMWEFSHLTMPLIGEKEGRNDMDICECTEVRLTTWYPQNTCKRKGLAYTVYLVEENLCHVLSWKLSRQSFL